MSLTKSEIEDIREKLIDIQLTLNSHHNTVTTDNIDAQPDETHWRIDHTKLVKQINEIARLLGINLCDSLRCSSANNQMKCGVIPAGTRVKLYEGSITLLEDTAVDTSQEWIDKAIQDQEDFNNDIGVTSEPKL